MCVVKQNFLWNWILGLNEKYIGMLGFAMIACLIWILHYKNANVEFNSGYIYLAKLFEVVIFT